MYKASIIVSFYNKIDFLRLVFAGLERQLEKNIEVVLADDGSRKEVVDELQALISELPFDVQHVWHEDDGWRKNIILNKAIAAAKSDYLIFMDADCIPHRAFVSEHVKNQEKGVILTGRRANLSEKLTAELTPDQVRAGKLEGIRLRAFWEGISGQTQHVEKSLYIKSRLARNYIQRKDSSILGCNFSMYREDILKLNGFDERYLSPACGEDTDLELRARNYGLKLKSVNYMAVQYHLYHKVLDRPVENLDILEENRLKQVGFTPYGINKSGS